ncbi:unnamed protein product [Symbiodinium natans]|uniref:Fungal lipase-type domain-containing protein n=1 Tax=Symbiodinium natans TaxID=878477 RepID=A0A812MK10_9DINO|nr:unnamed protein product [Symbiodinium natans]
MVEDERPVTEVVWYTVPLPGAAGQLGGLHSFLIITVTSDDEPAKRYVLEKAGSAATAAHQENGIFVGSQHMGSNLLSVEGVRTFGKQLTLAEGNLKKGLKMRELHQEADGTGLYDLSSSNCHHAALRVFNHCCARKEDRKSLPPNFLLAKFVGSMSSMFQLDDVFQSGRLQSDVASANSESAPSESYVADAYGADAPTGFTAPMDLCADNLTKMAALLSSAVYYKDPSSAVQPQGEAASVSIHNTLDRAVRVHLADAEVSHIFEADDSLSIQTHGRGKILVNVCPRWIPAHIHRLCLASKQPIWSGHMYELAKDFRGETVFREVLPFEVNVLHTTHKTSSKSPVMWLLARSGAAMYLAFRGTADVQDAAIDLSAVPDYGKFKEHGIGVHGGMAHTLEQEGDDINHVVKDVLQALDRHRGIGEPLVLCGHSLGGGYAQVMAVHLLSRDVRISAVRTFGSPHVLVPMSPQPGQLWQRLHAITLHWVHDWDPVPRLPLCKSWLVDVLPRLKQEFGGTVRVGMASNLIKQFQNDYDDRRAHLLEKYDVVGEVLLVSLNSGLACRGKEGAAPLKELLAEKPPEAVMTFSRLPAYHSMRDYLQIALKLLAV